MKICSMCKKYYAGEKITISDINYNICSICLDKIKTCIDKSTAELPHKPCEYIKPIEQKQSSVFDTPDYSYFTQGDVEIRCYPVDVALKCCVDSEVKNDKTLIKYACDKEMISEIKDKFAFVNIMSRNFNSFAGIKYGKLIHRCGVIIKRSEEEQLYQNGFNPIKRYTDCDYVWGDKIIQSKYDGIDRISEYFIFEYINMPIQKTLTKQDKIDTIRMRLEFLIDKNCIVEYDENYGFGNLNYYFYFKIHRNCNVLKIRLSLKG